MARKYVSASNQYLSSTTVPISVVPMTFACWFQVPEVDNENVLMAIADNSNVDHMFHLAVRGDQAGDPLMFGTRADGGADNNGQALSSTSVLANTWHHAIGTSNTSSNRDVYLDNGGAGNDTKGPIVPLLLDIFSIGSIEDSSPKRSDSTIVYAAIWNVVISAISRAMLAAGVCPLLVERESLIFYDPLPGHSNGDSHDLVGGLTMTATNAPTAAGDPPIIIWPGQTFVLAPPTAAPPAGDFMPASFSQQMVRF